MGDSGPTRTGLGLPLLGLVLGAVSTALGVGAVFWLALAGVAWSDGLTRGYSWEDRESELGIGIAVVFGLGWLVLLGVAVVALIKRPPATGAVVAVLVVVASVVVVAAAWFLFIPTLPPSEFPTPPWNRA